MMQELLTFLRPHHIAELKQIWDATPAVPSLSSRQAWALARNLKPAPVHVWFWHRKTKLLKSGRTTGFEEGYELPVGDPAEPMLVDEEDGRERKRQRPDEGGECGDEEGEGEEEEEMQRPRTRAWRRIHPLPEDEEDGGDTEDEEDDTSSTLGSDDASTDSSFGSPPPFEYPELSLDHLHPSLASAPKSVDLDSGLVGGPFWTDEGGAYTLFGSSTDSRFLSSDPASSPAPSLSPLPNSLQSLSHLSSPSSSEFTQSAAGDCSCAWCVPFDDDPDTKPLHPDPFAAPVGFWDDVCMVPQAELDRMKASLVDSGLIPAPDPPLDAALQTAEAREREDIMGSKNAEMETVEEPDEDGSCSDTTLVDLSVPSPTPSSSSPTPSSSPPAPASTTTTKKARRIYFGNDDDEHRMEERVTQRLVMTESEEREALVAIAALGRGRGIRRENALDEVADRLYGWALRNL
ncbi:hypothetical protein OF83DRAFT_1130446 [Amylostereum chailletii]|nr:hypothetical protein OF83DRAFT_1130446 [Amylostereum chailletii]